MLDLWRVFRGAGSRYLLAGITAASMWAWPACGQDLDAERADDEFELAHNLFRDAGDHATSSLLFAEFIRNHPGSRHVPEARLLLARSFARSGRCDLAVSAYEQFYGQHPEKVATAAARQERAHCIEELGEFARAAVAHEEIQRLFPGSGFAAQALLDAAHNYARAQQWPAARKSFDFLLAEYGNHRLADRARLGLARLAFAGGDAPGAQLLLDQIAGDDNSPDESAVEDALLLSGRIQLFLGHRAAAEEVFEKLQTRFSGSAHADSSRLEVADYASARGQYPDAVELYDQAHKHVGDENLRRQAAVRAADALRLQGSHVKALERYRRIADGGSGTLDSAQLGMAISFGHTGRLAESVGLFLRLIQRRDNDDSSATTATSKRLGAAAIRELAALYRRRGDLTRSATWFRHYLSEADQGGESFPESRAAQDQVRLQLGQVLDTAGYGEESVTQFRLLLRSGSSVSPQAQFRLAAAYEHQQQPQLALREYTAFLEQFPSHPLAANARDRTAYLREFTVLDPVALRDLLQQAWLDELNGRSRQEVRFRVARALREHRDYANAVRALETFVASYVGDSSVAEAQYYLADCLHLLARQRLLEERAVEADSLEHLAQQEFRILAEAGGVRRWRQQAQLRLVDAGFDSLAEDSRGAVVQERLELLLAQSDLDREVRGAALLKAADLRRFTAGDESEWRAVAESYRRVIEDVPESGLALRAKFFEAVALARSGSMSAASDSLQRLLSTAPGSDLTSHVLFELGQVLQAQALLPAAAARLEELLLAYPAFAKRREVQMLLASVHLDLENFSRAIVLLRQLVAAAPGGDLEGPVQRQLVLAYRRNGDHKAALALLELLLREHPEAAFADSLQLARGQLLMRLGRTDEAIHQFGQLRSNADREVAETASRAAGDLHFAAGRYQQAYESYRSLAPSSNHAAAGLAAICLFRTGEFEQARKLTKTVRKEAGENSPWSFILRIEEGSFHRSAGQFEKALKIFADLRKRAQNVEATSTLDAPPAGGLREIAEEPGAAADYYWATCLWDQNLHEITEERTVRALDAQSAFSRDHGSSAFGAAVHLRLGKYHYQVLSQYLPAAGAFRRVVDEPKARPTQKQEASYLLLQCYKTLFEYDEAHRIARRILEEYPEHPRANAVRLQIGYILKEKGQYRQAIDYLESVLEWAHGDEAAEARYYIGECFQNMGEYRQAIERFYRVSFHGAGVFAGWINSADFQRAECHEVLGEYAQAASIYDRIVQREGSESEFGKIAAERRRRVRQLVN